jgi:hypothetical protein
LIAKFAIEEVEELNRYAEKFQRPTPKCSIGILPMGKSAGSRCHGRH